MRAEPPFLCTNRSVKWRKSAGDGPCAHLDLEAQMYALMSIWPRLFPPVGLNPTPRCTPFPSVCIPVSTFVDSERERQRWASVLPHSAGLSGRKLNVCWLRETPAISLLARWNESISGLMAAVGSPYGELRVWRFLLSPLIAVPILSPLCLAGSSLFSDVPFYRPAQSHPVSSTQVRYKSSVENVLCIACAFFFSFTVPAPHFLLISSPRS